MTMPPRIDLLMNEDRRAVARERHGLFRCGAFAAARVRRPSIQNIRERYSDHVPPGPNTWTLNILPLWSVPPALRLSVSPIHIAHQCDPFATYRPVSCLSGSTICTCITACKSDGRRAGLNPAHSGKGKGLIKFRTSAPLCLWPVRCLPENHPFNTIGRKNLAATSEQSHLCRIHDIRRAMNGWARGGPSEHWDAPPARHLPRPDEIPAGVCGRTAGRIRRRRLRPGSGIPGGAHATIGWGP